MTLLDVTHQEGHYMKYHRSWKTTLFSILTVHGFGLAIGFILFGYVVGSQPPSTYPVFGYGKPPPIVIDGLSSYYWAIPSVIAGLIFLYLTIKSRRKDNRLDQFCIPDNSKTKDNFIYHYSRDAY